MSEEELSDKERAKPYWDEADRLWAKMRSMDGFFANLIGLPSGYPEFDRVKEEYETACSKAKEIDPNWRLNYD